tara:strand:+ start:3474 stop:3866 length:393 start_codon:yes stop_codon:yes gene_type:complete
MVTKSSLRLKKKSILIDELFELYAKIEKEKESKTKEKKVKKTDSISEKKNNQNIAYKEKAIIMCQEREKLRSTLFTLVTLATLILTKSEKPGSDRIILPAEMQTRLRLLIQQAKLKLDKIVFIGPSEYLM